jgi:hypothetical protein
MGCAVSLEITRGECCMECVGENLTALMRERYLVMASACYLPGESPVLLKGRT